MTADEQEESQEVPEILGTGQIEIMDVDEHSVVQKEHPPIKRPAKQISNPPPTPDVALLPDVVYYPLHVGKSPAITVQDAVRALSLDPRFEDMQSFEQPQLGVYCLARPTSPHRATPTNPLGPEVTIAYLGVGKGPKDHPQVWLRSAFTAYANEQSIGDIDRLRDEKVAAQRRGWSLFSIGTGIGLGVTLAAIATTWTYKGLDDSNRYASMNKATAEERLTLAKTQ